MLFVLDPTTEHPTRAGSSPRDRRTEHRFRQRPVDADANPLRASAPTAPLTSRRNTAAAAAADTDHPCTRVSSWRRQWRQSDDEGRTGDDSQHRWPTADRVDGTGLAESTARKDG